MPAASVSVCECAGDGSGEEWDGVEEADDAGGDGLALGELGLYRVVKLNLTPEIEVHAVLFIRGSL